jgi:hypothetical protein
MLTGLMGNDTEEMQRIEMLWPNREDLLIKRLGFRQPPGMVVLEGQFESLLNRCRWGGGHPK